MADKIVPDQRARGGPKGKPVLYVLVAAIILLGIYMVVMVGWAGKSAPPPNTPINGGAASSPANSSAVPPENPAYPSPAAPRSGGQGSAPANGQPAQR